MAEGKSETGEDVVGSGEGEVGRGTSVWAHGPGMRGGQRTMEGGGEKSSLGWAIKGSRPCCDEEFRGWGGL